MTIKVRPDWRSWEVSEVQLKDLSRLHWYHPPGAPRELLHAYVSAERVSALGATVGETPNVRVVILKSDTTPDIYADLLRHLEQTAAH